MESPVWSVDIFLTIENVLNTITGFIYSVAFSLYMLFRFPNSAPRLLQRRLRDPDVRQVGPLTLNFLAMIGALSPWLLLVGKTPSEIITKLHDATSVYAMVFAAFVATGALDAFVRLSIAAGWPVRFVNAVPRQRFSVRQSRALYSLVLPAMTATLAWLITFVLTIIVLVVDRPFFADMPYRFLLAPLAINIYVFLIILMPVRYFGSSFLQGLCDRGGASYKKFAREGFFVSMIVCVLLCLRYTNEIVGRLYPAPSALAELAAPTDIQYLNFQCTWRADKLHVFVWVWNRNKSDMAIFHNAAKVSLKTLAGALVFEKMITPNNSSRDTSVIGPAATFDYTSDIDVKAANLPNTWTCTVVWNLPGQDEGITSVPSHS